MRSKDVFNFQEYEMADGEYVAMSTAPILLLSLRNKNKKAYEKISKVLVKGVNEKDVMEVYEFMHSAYLNANQDEEEENLMTFKEFIENANPDYMKNVNVVQEMISPSKKQDSEQPSEEQQ